MEISWIEIARWTAMLGIFFGMFFWFMKYSLRFFEGVKSSGLLDPGSNREAKRTSRYANFVINNLVGFELALGAMAIWCIWSELPGMCLAALVLVFVVVQIALSIAERHFNPARMKGRG